MSYGPIDRVARYPVWLGVVLLTCGFTISYLSTQAMQNLGMKQAGTIKLTPGAIDPGKADLLSSQLFSTTLRAVYRGLSSLGVLLTIIGLCSVLIGVVFVRRRLLMSAGKRLISALAKPRRFVLLWGLLAFVAGVVSSPLFQKVVVNIVLFLVAGAPVFFVNLLILANIEQRTGSVTTVLFVWPFAVGVPLLSVIAGTLASPATGEFVRWVTSRVVRFLLSTVLSIGDLNQVLMRVFELEGGGFLAFWVAVDFIIGVMLGIASQYYRLISLDVLTSWIPDITNI